MLENVLTEDHKDLIKKWTEIMSYTVTMLQEIVKKHSMNITTIWRESRKLCKRL